MYTFRREARARLTITSHIKSHPRATFPTAILTISIVRGRRRRTIKRINKLSSAIAQLGSRRGTPIAPQLTPAVIIRSRFTTNARVRGTSALFSSLCPPSNPFCFFPSPLFLSTALGNIMNEPRGRREIKISCTRLRDRYPLASCEERGVGKPSGNVKT